MEFVDNTFQTWFYVRKDSKICLVYQQWYNDNHVNSGEA